MEALRNNLALDATDAAYREIILFLVLRRPNLTLDDYLAQFQLARRRAEARLPMARLSSLCIHYAGIAPNQKSMVTASTRGDLSLVAAKRHMRRSLGPCGMGMKQDALLLKNDPNKVNLTP